MAHEIARIINYLIGGVFMTYFLFVLKGKSVNQPQMKIYGQPVKTFIALLFIGICIDALLIMAILFGWIK